MQGNKAKKLETSLTKKY